MNCSFPRRLWHGYLRWCDRVFIRLILRVYRGQPDRVEHHVSAIYSLVHWKCLCAGWALSRSLDAELRRMRGK